MATRRRQENAGFLDERLPDLFHRPADPQDAVHVFHQYTVSVPERQRIFELMRGRGVGVDVYYPSPVHHQPAYEEFADRDDCPNAIRASQTVLSLPVHPNLSEKDLGRIVEAAHEAVDGL